MSAESNARRLAEIQQRVDRSTLTPAPWSAGPEGGVRRGAVCVFPKSDARYAHQADIANAEFAAHARDDVPWLLARVKQLEAALAGGFRARTADADLDPIDDEG